MREISWERFYLLRYGNRTGTGRDVSNVGMFVYVVLFMA